MRLCTKLCVGLGPQRRQESPHPQALRAQVGTLQLERERAHDPEEGGRLAGEGRGHALSPALQPRQGDGVSAGKGGILSNPTGQGRSGTWGHDINRGLSVGKAKG